MSSLFNAENSELRLTDEAIGAIARLVQIAIITGTDIVDNLRTMQLVNIGDGRLAPSPEFLNAFNRNIESMLEQSAQHSSGAGNDTFETR